MLTIFSTPKPFRGHIGIIQRNALQSWKRIAPDVEVILFGNEDGAAEAARELGLRHEPRVERNEQGSKLLPYIFRRAQEAAGRNLLCYCNCDILQTGELLAALRAVSAWRDRFLLVGRRWDLDITEPLDFSTANWQAQLPARAVHRTQAAGDWSRGLGQLSAAPGAARGCAAGGRVAGGHGHPPKSRLRLPPTGGARRVARRAGAAQHRAGRRPVEPVHD
jgi:hypothetical protein